MVESEFEARQNEIRESFEDEEQLYASHARGSEHIFEGGLGHFDLSGGRRGGHLIVPNERLALLWKSCFRVQLTDGGWKNQDGEQLRHPFSYSDAKIEVDTSRQYPEFTGYTTHEKITPPEEHFQIVPSEFSSMVYLVRLAFGIDDYGYDDLMDDLRLFENMEYTLAEAEMCSKCNQNIY